MPATFKCPNCATKLVWSEALTFRPFCSERCKLIDLGAWASDGYVMQGNNPSTPSEQEAIEQAIEKVLEDAFKNRQGY